MATSSLVHTASRQLRHLLLWTPRSITMVTPQPRRFCQDDSKQRKLNNPRAKDTGDKKEVKATGPAVNLLERDLQDILQEQQKQERLQQRSSLQCRMDLLISLGCTMDQIQDRVRVLDLSEQVILRRASMLKNAGCKKITVDLLLTSYHTKVDKLRQHLSRAETLEAATCTVLRCTRTELQQLKRDHPSLTRVRCMTGDAILEKEKLLQSYGITWQQIKEFPGILNIRVENLKQRLDILKGLRKEGTLQFEKYPLNVVADRTRGFEKCIKRAISHHAEIDGSPITLEKIAQRLGVTKKDMEDVSLNFHKLGPSRVLQKIDYLLGQGISNTDILSHIYMMKYRLEIIQSAVEKSKEVMVSHSPSIYVILSLLRSGHIPQKSFVWSRQRTYMASLLGIKVKELPGSEYYRPLWSTDRVCIKRNFDFLISEGFNVQDIFSCLILLAHDPDCLQTYYSNLWQRPEVAKWVESDAWTEKKQTLSLLQYVMEKDMNFTSVVFHAEVEFDQGYGQAGQESHDVDSSAKSDSEHPESHDEDWAETEA